MPLRPKMELQDYGKLFLRRKWLIVFTVLFILFAASVYCVVTPELYKSSATILIFQQGVPQDYVRSTVTVKVEEQLATIRQQVMSRTTLMKVMEELRLFEKERKNLPPEEVVELMRKRILIEGGQGKSRDPSEAFTLSFLDENPQMAMQGAARLASFFIDENLKNREQQAVGTSEFLESQLKETKDKLEVLEAKVKDYKMRYMGELPQQMDANLRILAGLQDRLRSIESSARALEDRKVYLEAQLSLTEKSIATTVTDNGKTVYEYIQDPSQALENQLAQKKAKLADLNAKYTTIHPTVLATRQEVAELENRIAEIQGSAPDPADGKQKTDPPLPSMASPSARGEIGRMNAQLKASTVEIASLKREKNTTQKNIAAVEQKIERSPKREQEMISLVRDYENQKKSYDDLLRKKLEADVSQNLEKRQKGTGFQILDPANLPRESFKPDRKKAMGIALLLALAFGFGGTIFLESMDLRLRDVRDFRHLYKVPILGCIPVLQDQEYQREQAMRRAAVFGGLITFTMAFSILLLVYRAKVQTILNF